MKSKRVRTIFTPEQLERLEGEFERQQYMVGPERLYLAHTLQLTEAQVSFPVGLIIMLIGKRVLIFIFFLIFDFSFFVKLGKSLVPESPNKMA